jgi:hypothetical protein
MRGGLGNPAPMKDRVRNILIAAVEAGRYGTLPAPPIAEAIVHGNRELTLDHLQFDSLAWMEFCISVELQSGQELTPGDIANMRYVFEIEEWIRARI